MSFQSFVGIITCSKMRNMSSLHVLKFLPLICLMLVLVPDQCLCVEESRDANVLCIEKERQALLEFKHALVDHYGRLSSWKSQDCCLWNGVQCNNQTGHVEMLDLRSDYQFLQPLGGEISTSLMNLLHLKFLNLDANDFSGRQIPEFLGSLTNLRHLELSNARFEGKIPYQLGKLSNLQFLDLSYNYLVGAIPNQLGNLSNLHTLRLGFNNNLTFGEENSADTRWISNLSSLTELGLRTINLHNSINSLQMIGRLPFLAILRLPYCRLSDVDFYHLSSSQQNSSTSLTYLELHYNNLTSSIFPWLFNFSSNLVELFLNNNFLRGSIPYDFGNRLPHLELLYLYNNQLNGTLPESIGLLSEMQDLDIGNNFLEGVISEIHFANFTRLKFLDLKENSLTLKFDNSWIPPFQLEELLLQNCKVGPAFPKWLQTQNQLSLLDISNTGISDTIKESLFLLCSDGANNNNSMRVLYMSDNQLSGQIPDCLSNLKSLLILDVRNNYLSGNIPITMGSLVEIRLLILQNNMLTGQLPSLKNCTKLALLDVGENKLTGPTPSWLGDSLQSLEMLILRKNRFYGHLPSCLCHLTNIQVLDLSFNNLSGQIPKCLNNFSALLEKHEIKGSEIKQPVTSFVTDYVNFTYYFYPFLMWKGRELYFKEIGRLLKMIDLSNNQLSGEISTEFGDMIELVSLNLSRNNLSGQIPSELGKLHSLDFLDLSRNHLRGKIPLSLSQINRLSVLDLSNNNLSGKIPTGTQLQSFNASVYSGNPELCGSPLMKPCPQEMSEDRHKVARVDLKEEYPLLSEGVYVSAGLGFFIGFWGIFGSLLFIHPWRHVYFNFLNNLTDWIYVMATIYVARFSKWLNN